MRFFALVLALACSLPSVAQAMGKGKPGDQTSLLKELFRGAPEYRSGYGKRTFIIYVNGDADHFVTDTSESDPEKAKLSRVDAADVRKIDGLARSCGDCNVVLLHDQRGTDHWYTKDDPWAVFLRIYTVGTKVFERSISEVNGADPAVIARMLQYSQRAFPQSGLYFVYRGHSIIPSYDPAKKSEGIAPFDYSHPESPYGVPQFAEAFRQANLSTPLNAVVMAACSMADLDLADALAPYARALISPQLDVLETLSAGFGYRFLTELDSVSRRSEAIEKMASLLLEPIQRAKNPDDALMEYPVSLLDLAPFGKMKSRVTELVKASGVERAVLNSRARLVKSLSLRTVEIYRQKGKSEAQLQALIRGTRQASQNPHSMDLKRVLELVAEQARARGDAVLDAKVATLENELSGAVRVWDRPNHSLANGLTLQMEPSGVTL